MKTPREILIHQHEAAIPKLDAIRAGVVAGIAAKSSAEESFSWRDLIRSVRWHLAVMSAACVVAFFLSIDYFPDASPKIALEKSQTPQQFWAMVRERQKLFLEYSEVPTAEAAVAAPGRRSEIAPNWVEV